MGIGKQNGIRFPMSSSREQWVHPIASLVCRVSESDMEIEVGAIPNV